MACNDALLAPLESFVSFWWVKEYQELLAALLALAAAFFVGLPVHKQLREMRRQSSAAAISNVRTAAYELEELQAELEASYRQISALHHQIPEYIQENWHHIYETWPDRVWKSANDLHDFSILLQKSINRSATGLERLEETGVRTSNELRNSLYFLVRTFNHGTRGAFDDEEDVSDQGPTAYANAYQNWQTWLSWWQEYQASSFRNTAQMWRKVRLLENDAVGHQD
jgi:hypothetical protein